MNDLESIARIALVQPEEICEWERGDIGLIRAMIDSDGGPRKLRLTDVGDSDLVVLLEANKYFGRERISYYESLPWLSDPVRLCAVNYEDRPAGFLPGMYTSLHRRNFDPQLHVSWPALRYYNDAVEAKATELAIAGFADKEEPWLFSFVGSASNPIRKAVLALSDHADARGFVAEVKRWYDHSVEEKYSYVNVLLNSTFVLCPRGVAAYSHRILEALALGKVPVILADDWVPFSVDSNDYYVRIPERDVRRVPEILRCDYASAASRLKSAAQDVYRRHFDVRFRYTRALERLLQLQRECLDGLPKRQLMARWRSRSFWRANGWCVDQRIARMLARFAATVRYRSML